MTDIRGLKHIIYVELCALKSLMRMNYPKLYALKKYKENEVCEIMWFKY